jgi:beta-lactamase superfamily II metal-dependent hydrolase
MKLKYLIASCIVIIAVFTLTGCPAYEPQDEPPAPNPATPATPTAPAIPNIPAVPDTPATDKVSVHVLNVGEGLSVFIDDGDAEVLIDGGYMKYGEGISGYISDYVDGDIEYVIATHSDGDHVGGLIRIYADYQVDCTIYGNTTGSATFLKFENAMKNEPDTEYRNDKDETLELSEGVTLRTIDVIDNAKKPNNNSVISILDVGGRKLLITGDAEAVDTKTEIGAENLLLGKIGKVDVYVVGHHGSETSSSQAFLDEIRPEYGIISTAGPSHKDRNPDEEVMERLSEIGTKLYATYRSGNITVTFDDGAISLSPPESQQITPQNYKEAA